jgi:dUTP pyrophosphatase
VEKMQSVRVDVVLEAGATLPAYQTAGAAGLDLCCSEPVRLEPLQRAVVGTGVRMSIPLGFEGQVRPRSGLAARHGITMVNSPGTIDSDYRGEIKLILVNLGQEVVQFAIGERLAQLVMCPVVRAELVVVNELDESTRGEKGFGSTGT